LGNKNGKRKELYFFKGKEGVILNIYKLREQKHVTILINFSQESKNKEAWTRISPTV